MLLFQTTQQVADSLQVAAEKLDQAIAQADGLDKLGLITQQLIDSGIQAGGHILKAVIVFLVGRFLIRMLNRLVGRVMDKRNVDISIKTFVKSLVNILLTVLLIVSVVGALGVETTSFAALLASAGVAVGMALSGNLQNFAGGLVILLFKPYKVGDWIEAQSVSGTVKEIQIFHTILTTADNKLIYVPNGALSSGVVTNYSNQKTRRVEWIFGVDYGEDYNKVEKVVREVLTADKRILNDPAPFIALHALDASSVNVVVRVWVESSDYWGVYFDINKTIYATFNEKGINFSFPQLTVHQAPN
ncbi:mechanosensitive ion channel family protein [Bacteroides fragilis]